MSESMNPPRRLRYVYLRQGSRVEEGVLAKSLIRRIQDGDVSGWDEISGDGINWNRLDEHPQLIPFLDARPYILKKEITSKDEEWFQRVFSSPLDGDRVPPSEGNGHKTFPGSNGNGSENGDGIQNGRKEQVAEPPDPAKNLYTVSINSHKEDQSVFDPSSPGGSAAEEEAESSADYEDGFLKTQPSPKGRFRSVSGQMVIAVLLVLLIAEVGWFFPHAWIWIETVLCVALVSFSAWWMIRWEKRQQTLKKIIDSEDENLNLEIAEDFCLGVKQLRMQNALRTRLALHMTQSKKRKKR